MTTIDTNVFPILTASTTDAEMLRLLRNPEMAIGFALEHLQPYELAEFFHDWKADADMTGWLAEWHEKQDSISPKPASEPDYSDMRAFNRADAAKRKRRKATH